MINAAQTQPPETLPGAKIQPAGTIPPESTDLRGRSVKLLPGDTVGDGYVINAPLDDQGQQSDVYLAKRRGEQYVVKLYHIGWRLPDRLQSFLTRVSHPNVARILDCGDWGGQYYEVYDYYPEGSLEDSGSLSSQAIQEVLVPSVNEGLHELHKNGIIHRDIKPANLFFADGRKRVVIGDCGVSGFANADGVLRDALCGTPEYAPLVMALPGVAAISTAYDYGSFGYVLCRAVLGRSLFSGMSTEEIAEAKESGIELPGRINGRIAQLIKGLIAKDEKGRWGYDEVKRWCEGEFVSAAGGRVPRGGRHHDRLERLIFGQFEGRTIAVTSLQQLTRNMEQHWSQATMVIKKKQLQDFVRQFKPEIADDIRELARCQDADAAVFKLLLQIREDPEKIVFCGKTYESLAAYVEALASGRDETAKQFFNSDLLELYLRSNGCEESLIRKLEDIRNNSRWTDAEKIATVCLALQGSKTLDVFGVSVASLDDLIPVLRGRSLREIDKLLRDGRFIAWMNRMGYGKEMQKIKEVDGTG